MKPEVSYLKKRLYTEPYSLKVEMPLKEELDRLKREKGIDVSEEVRKAMRDMVKRLYRAS